MDSQVGDTTAGSPAGSDSPSLSDTSASTGSATDASSSAGVPTDFRAALSQEPTSQGSDAAKLRGPIPYDRHETILGKERTTREALEAKWKPYEGLQELVPGSDWGKWQAHIQGLRTNPIGQIESLINEALSHPELSAVARQRISALVNAGQTQQAAVEAKAATTQADDDPMPGADMDGGYSIDGLKKLNAWNQRQAKAQALDEMRKEFKPLIDEHKTAQQQREVEKAKTEAQSWATKTFESVKKLPHFEDFQKDIAAEFEKRKPALGQSPSNGDVAALMYQVYAEVVTPNVGKVAQKKQLDELATKARATTTSPTGQGKAVAAKKPVAFRDALGEAFRTR